MFKLNLKEKTKIAFRKKAKENCLTDEELMTRLLSYKVRQPKKKDDE